jgi:hypothetical protein
MWEGVIKIHVVELKVIMFIHFMCASAKLIVMLGGMNCITHFNGIIHQWG